MTDATDASASALYLGLMSGTSADGIDAALVRFEGEGRALRCQLVHGRTFAWDEATRTRLVALGQGAPLMPAFHAALRPARSPSKQNTTSGAARNSSSVCSGVVAVPSVATAIGRPA